MYFRKRGTTDKIGLCLTYGLITYMGAISGPFLLWDELRDSPVTRMGLVFLNAMVFLDIFLLIYVSTTRGYVETEEYVPGGKFCYDCKKAKPERAHHCSRCKTCINRMDHHCPWVGSCVNANNLGNFIKLITCIFLSSVLCLGLHGYAFHKKVQVLQDPFSVSTKICMIGLNICLLTLISCGVLLILIRQLRLLARNITYLESLQIRILKRLGVVVPHNPYDKGTLHNIRNSLGGIKGFLLCQEPEDAHEFGYSEYWPPMRMSKSVTSSRVAINTDGTRNVE
ncbi:hypothetical protein NEAUS04_1557 [Nematocida ausubeli]|uniref:Palmitoyltransferase n=1 Tax=Nematocida ausubeli (strain ATCC PRA-371 / ERTm2) TaxID=1913371 RepID=A0A086J5J4_NEMA1|nr:uncharacterized protein NESG_00490 [Nematocida ausubeli]KAI5136851.1 hypothetical protein NEAUS06_2046 [Nematocida ausubeli]KAI5149248.1 hypothetical protein NEAUS05_1696 [Nematocida ausubeli]KAI5163429.1 hypothetical protein NEAUS04_1557 [Nematocida ausubeli]KFG27412.1 hypothetical protein NESG_00490 [Nematocida ausubeli]